ncbi:hypothetical protein [Paenibacillus azoreducens]|uniref:Uncharacterized protein n=1 Tax=Paenibacillus azoreducens TaxID=116718 RepID=A0A919YAA1_9BACL|nr:hypothetical protein [Paenibacillus azoreducens]GIO47089.1 hypothetical protein J34TS1_18540 [Paenibacillus azoreducens]
MILDALEREWNNLYDVEENPYWSLENVTSHDKSLAFHKLKRTVETALHDLYQRELTNHIDQMKREGDDMWITFSKQVHNASETITAADIWNLRNQLDRLFLHFTSLEKARLLSNSHGISLDTTVSSAELNSVDLVSISSADLKKAPENNGHGLIKSTSETAKNINPTDENREQVIAEGTSGTAKHEGNSTTSARHVFEVEEKVALPQPNRIQYNNCILEKDGQIWFVEQYEPFKSAGENTRMYIRMDDVPYRIHISDEDVRDLQLSVGASIDVAFWENNPTLPKVLWENRDK